jgi:hypothetical protein
VNTSFPPVRFGAIIAFSATHPQAEPLLKKIENKAKEKGINTSWGIGPQEFYTDAAGQFAMQNGYVVYTGKDADNYLAFRKAESQAADDDKRQIQKQLKELGPPPAMSDFTGPGDDFWRAFEAYEKRTMVWRIFNPTVEFPTAYDFQTRKPDDFYDFKPIAEVETAFENGTLDITA